MPTILTADSGSTKTHWILSGGQDDILEIKTSGINPVRDSQDVVLHVLHHELLPQLPPHSLPQHVWFYGAGCIAPFSETIHTALRSLMPEAAIHVDTDLVGAARALCGDKPGIACILGTGANCGLYDGQHITENVPPLGFILGDEGSGAVLGRALLGNIFKGLLSPHLRDAFTAETGITQAEAIRRVYREKQPNIFLASQVPFIARHINDAEIHEMVVEAMHSFVVRNVVRFKSVHNEANFVGSIAHIFRRELHDALALEGMQLGLVLQSPALRITQYHLAHK
ncbi:MAG: ATPase [Bacteroidaceae bacterium]|nr:ATPase [Bacteroidaceae bacterium]